MIAFTAAEIADITNGRLAADPGITPGSVVTDSREATTGSLYVAKPGENADGHDFVAAAFDRGAVLALAERDVADDAGRNYPAVVVQDAVLAMGALAAEAVRRIRARRAAGGEQLTVIGITGSAGKTTTKDLLAGILAAEAHHRGPAGFLQRRSRRPAHGLPGRLRHPVTSSSKWAPPASATSATSRTWSARTSAWCWASAPPTPANSAAWTTSPSPRASSWKPFRPQAPPS